MEKRSINNQDVIAIVNRYSINHSVFNEPMYITEKGCYWLTFGRVHFIDELFCQIRLFDKNAIHFV